MHNIQKLIEKPIVIQAAEGSVEQSYGKDSLSTSKPAASSFAKRAPPSEEDEIVDEVESMPQSEGDSIPESIEQSRQSESQQLSSARRLLGSEQAVIRSSKDLLSKKSKGGSSVFDKNSFQTFTSNKFKDLLLNEGSMMEGFLDQIEAAVDQKSKEEAKNLKR